jgi:hypothetical protein
MPLGLSKAILDSSEPKQQIQPRARYILPGSFERYADVYVTGSNWR